MSLALRSARTSHSLLRSIPSRQLIPSLTLHNRTGRRPFIGQVIGVIANPLETLRQLDESRKLLEQTRQAIPHTLHVLRGRICVMHTKSRRYRRCTRLVDYRATSPVLVRRKLLSKSSREFHPSLSFLARQGSPYMLPCRSRTETVPVWGRRRFYVKF